MREVYRPLRVSSLSVLQESNEIIESQHQKTCEIIIMADFNINLLENNGSVLIFFWQC